MQPDLEHFQAFPAFPCSEGSVMVQGTVLWGLRLSFTPGSAAQKRAWSWQGG